MLHPQAEVNHLSFLRPFKWKLWASFLCLWLFFSLNLTLISYLSRRKSSNKNEKKPNNGKEEEEEKEDDEEENFSFLESVWYFSLVGIQMGMDQHPKSPSGRILIFAWSAFTLIIVATYTANLAAFFTMEAYHRPLRSISGQSAYFLAVT